MKKKTPRKQRTRTYKQGKPKSLARCDVRPRAVVPEGDKLSLRIIGPFKGQDSSLGHKILMIYSKNSGGTMSLFFFLVNR